MTPALPLALMLTAALASPANAVAVEAPAAPATASDSATVPAGPGQMDPEVRRAVDAMQKFYEETLRFEADFEQRYSYTTLPRTMKSTGRLRFLKSGASMRWDYAKPTEKSFVVAAEKVFVYDKEAKQILVAEMDSDRLSASISFLWGQGKLDQEFFIQKSTREDLKDGIALELTPKKTDPRFQKIYFLINPENYSVKETLVIDPDGSENHVTFKNVRTDGTFGKEAFLLEPPPDVEVIRYDQSTSGVK
jgi:outer membrane lipoprotein carrier protein